MDMASDDSSIPKQIEEWAKKNDWYDTNLDSNQLKVEMAFGGIIQNMISQLEYYHMRDDRKRLLNCWNFLLEECRKIDRARQAVCQTRAQRKELECLRSDAILATVGLAHTIQIIQEEASNCSSKPVVKSNREVNWIALSQAAEILMINRSTVLRWAKKGKLIDNGQCGRSRMVTQNSVLIAKQAREDQEIQKDVKDIRKDARKYI